MSNSVYPNPFESPGRPEKQLRLKCCLWEVLKDFPHGLTVSAIVSELQRRGLKDFSARKNAAGQVSGDLVRHRDAFVHDPVQRVWYIKPLAPKGLPCKATVLKPRLTKRANCRKEKNPMFLGSSSSSSPLKGTALLNYPVRVWWPGDAKFFQGKIVNYEPTTNSYSILYDDGDTDYGIQFRKYEVLLTDSGCESVIVHETEGDDLEMAAADAITQLKNSTFSPQPKQLLQSYLKQEMAHEPMRRQSQEFCMQPLKALVTEMNNALNKTVENYHKELSWLQEMFYTMRGCRDSASSKDKMVTVGDLAHRLERAALDTGVFANTIDEERGIQRLHRFCFEGFIQSARAVEHQVDVMVQHSLNISQQVVWLAPDFIAPKIQEILQRTAHNSLKPDTSSHNNITSSTSSQREEDSMTSLAPIPLYNACNRFQQLHNLLNEI